MGTIIFIILHLIALFFGVGFLIITIPLHLIYSNTKASRKLMKKQTELMETQIKNKNKDKNVGWTVDWNNEENEENTEDSEVSNKNNTIFVIVLSSIIVIGWILIALEKYFGITLIKDLL